MGKNVQILLILQRSKENIKINHHMHIIPRCIFIVILKFPARVVPSPCRLHKMFLLDFLVVGKHLRVGEGDRGEGVKETHRQVEGTHFTGRAMSRDTGNLFLPENNVHICFSLLWYDAAWGRGNRRKQLQRC